MTNQERLQIAYKNIQANFEKMIKSLGATNEK